MFKHILIGLLLATFAGGTLAQSGRTIEMTVDGLVCAFCAQGIEKKLRKLDATADVVVSLEHKIVAVALKDQKDLSDAELKDLLTDAGYTLREVKRSSDSLEAIRKRMSAS